MVVVSSILNRSPQMTSLNGSCQRGVSFVAVLLATADESTGSTSSFPAAILPGLVLDKQ